MPNFRVPAFKLTDIFNLLTQCLIQSVTQSVNQSVSDGVRCKTLHLSPPYINLVRHIFHLERYAYCIANCSKNLKSQEFHLVTSFKASPFSVDVLGGWGSTQDEAVFFCNVCTYICQCH